MSWLKQHWQGVATVLSLAVAFAGGLGTDRLTLRGPTLDLPAELSAEPGDFVAVPADSNCPNLYWDVQPRLPSHYLASERALLLSARAAGKYVVTCEVARGSKIARASCVVTVGTPPPPVPPVPPVPPTPPEPPAPIPAAGLHVLVVIDTDPSKLTAAQRAALNGQAVRSYLNATCPKGPDGKTAEWRVWTADTDAANESPLWQAAFSAAKGKALPLVIVSNGKTGFVGPLPADADSLLALLKKYGS